MRPLEQKDIICTRHKCLFIDCFCVDFEFAVVPLVLQSGAIEWLKEQIECRADWLQDRHQHKEASGMFMALEKAEKAFGVLLKEDKRDEKDY